MAENENGNGKDTTLQDERDRLLAVVITLEQSIRDAMGLSLEDGISYPQICYVLDMLSLDMKCNLRETWMREMADAETGIAATQDAAKN